MTTGTPAARMASATRYALAIMRVIAPIPTSAILFSITYWTRPASLMGCVLPSISSTSWSGGVSDCSRNIHRCGMKFRVTPLSGQ